VLVAAVVIVWVIAAASLFVVNGVTGWIASAVLVWAAWTHRVSSIRGWLLSTVIVTAAVFLFLLSVWVPLLVKSFLFSVRVGFVAAAVVALATTQWFPALALSLGALLAQAVREAATTLEGHSPDTEKREATS